MKKHLSEDEIFLRHVRQQEMMVRRIKKSAEKRGKLIEKQVLVMDLKDLSFRIDFMAMRCFRKLLQYDDSCYPERLHVCFMINAPMSFTATWAIIKPWLDPVTAEKMQIIGSNYQDKLKEYIDVEQIPIEYGGTKENFSWVWDNNYED